MSSVDGPTNVSGGGPGNVRYSMPDWMNVMEQGWTLGSACTSTDSWYCEVAWRQNRCVQPAAKDQDNRPPTTSTGQWRDCHVTVTLARTTLSV